MPLSAELPPGNLSLSWRVMCLTRDLVLFQKGQHLVFELLSLVLADVAQNLNNADPVSSHVLKDLEPFLDVVLGRDAVQSDAQHQPVFYTLCSALSLI